MTHWANPDHEPAAAQPAGEPASHTVGAGFGFPGAARSAMWAEAVGVALFALAGRYACNQWVTARMRADPRLTGLAAAFLPEVCWLGAIAAQAAWLTVRRRGGVRALGLRRERVEAQVLWGIGIGVAAVLTSYVVGTALIWMSGTPTRPQWPESLTAALVGSQLVYFVLTALGTETLFRGLLLPRLCHGVQSALGGIVLCALVEAVPYWTAHYDWRTIVCRIAVRVVTNALYLRVRSLWAAVLGNVTYDFLAGVLLPRL